jgi:hypothetical protein
MPLPTKDEHWLTVYDCSREQAAHTNISLDKARARLTDSIRLSRSSPPHRSQRDVGGGSTRVRMRFPFPDSFEAKESTPMSNARLCRIAHIERYADRIHPPAAGRMKAFKS